MKPTYLNELSSSFMLWLDHEILLNGEAFYNKIDEPLTYAFDPNFKNYKVYGSPYRQWVCDSDIPNAIVASGITSGNAFVPKSVNDVRIDYGMGRAVLKSATPSNLTTLKASFSVKEFNLYFTSKSMTNLLFDDAEQNIMKTPRLSTGALNYKDEPYPCIYVKFTNGKNEPFALGGLDQSDWDVRCTVLADSAFSLDAVCSILADSAHHSFPRIPASGIPFNFCGDFRDIVSGYSYCRLANEYPRNLVYIDEVSISKFDEKVNRAIKDDLWGAFVDFRLLDVRN